MLFPEMSSLEIRKKRRRSIARTKIRITPVATSPVMVLVEIVGCVLGRDCVVQDARVVGAAAH